MMNKKNVNIFFDLKLFLLWLFISCHSYGQNMEMSIPREYLSKISVSQKQRDSIKSKLAAPYYLVNALPKGYLKDGSKDYTFEIQKALLEYRNVIFPNFPLLINEKGLTIQSNSNLFFEKNSKLVLKKNASSHYEIIKIHDVSNVNVYFANIEGDKFSHIGKDGEWGMGISIRGTSNILIYAPQVSKCWGDGIYLGISPTTNNVNNKNVKIVKGLIDNNRRNGISIIAGENLDISNLIVANTYGTPPMAGIDIEPDSNTDIIKNMRFNNIISFNNATHGFLFALGGLYGKNSDIGEIKLTNFHADYGDLGISFKIGSGENKPGRPAGNIEITNTKFTNLRRQEYLSYPENNENNIQIKIKAHNDKDLKKYNTFFNNSQKIIISR